MLGWFLFAGACAILVNGHQRTGTHNGALMLAFLLVELFVIWAGGFWA